MPVRAARASSTCGTGRSAENRHRPTGAPRRNRGPGCSPCADGSRPVPKAVGPGRVVHFRRGSRFRVAATVDHGTHREPAVLERPLGLARRGAGGQHVVADHDRDRVRRRARGAARSRDAPPSSRSGWPPARAASSPAWSSTRPRTLEQRRTHHDRAVRDRSRRAAARVIRSIGSCPRARTTAGREGTGTSTVGPRLEDRRRPPAASTRPSGAASAKTPCSLWASTIARRSASYSPAAKQAASPSGHGVGRTDVPRSGRAAAQSRHSDRPGRAAAHAAAAVDEVEPGVEHPRTHAAAPSARRQRREHALWTTPHVRRPCGRRSAHVRGRGDLGVGARPVAVAAQRVEPLVGGDQQQRQVRVRARPPSPGPRRGRRSARPGRGRPASRRTRRS